MRSALAAVVKNIKNVVINKMKIWKEETNSPTHKLVKLNCEQHSNYIYAGDFDDKALAKFLFTLDQKADLEKNIKLLKYYGYLHLFVIHPT